MRVMLLAAPECAQLFVESLSGSFVFLRVPGCSLENHHGASVFLRVLGCFLTAPDDSQVSHRVSFVCHAVPGCFLVFFGCSINLTDMPTGCIAASGNVVPVVQSWHCLSPTANSPYPHAALASSTSSSAAERRLRMGAPARLRAR